MTRSAVPKTAMDAEAFLAWAVKQPNEAGRFELIDGVIVAQQSERAVHWEVKLAVAVAFRDAIRTAGLPCYAAVDGPMVRISARKLFQPDGLVYCGDRAPADALEVNTPVILWEVLSPDSTGRDHGDKVESYFGLPSLHHYLIVDPDRRAIIHHRRGSGDEILTRVRRSGALVCDPPGLTIDLAQVFERP